MNKGLLAFAGFLGIVTVYGPKASVFLVLKIYRKAKLLWLRLKGSSEEKEIQRKVTSGRAWEEFCDTLKAAGTSLLAPGAPMSPFDQAEGVRYLTRILRAGLVNMMECKNYYKPKFTAVANGYTDAPVKLGSDNPDNLYQAASVSSRFVYRLKAKRNTVDFLGFYAQKGFYGKAGGLSTVDSKESQDFKIDSKGFITVLIGAQNIDNSENYLKLDPEIIEALVLVRQTFKRRDLETAADLVITKIGEFEYDEELKKLGKFTKDVEVGANTTDLDPNDLFSNDDKVTCQYVVDALEGTGLLVTGASLMFANWAYGFQKHVNTLPLFDVERSNKVGGDPTIRYYHSYWKLSEDECLVITAKPPPCFTWNFQVNNHWMESLDYRYFRVHVNMATAKYKEDGSVVVILSLKNPQKSLTSKQKFIPYNWLSTTGHTQGTMCWRWIKPESYENLPQPLAKVVKFVDLPKIILE